jgi:hypothetical protein
MIARLPSPVSGQVPWVLSQPVTMTGTPGAAATLGHALASRKPATPPTGKLSRLDRRQAGNPNSAKGICASANNL